MLSGVLNPRHNSAPHEGNASVLAESRLVVMNPLDPSGLQKAAHLLRASPWVQHVERVQRVSDDQVRVYVDREQYAVNTDSVTLFRYFLEPMGISVDKWSMGVRGRALVESNYTWDRVAADMLEIYRWMASGGPAPQTILAPRQAA